MGDTKDTARSGPRLAVMPFDNLSAQPSQDYFSRGFVDDLIVDLSRFSDLLVVAGRPGSDASTTVDYTLCGTLRREANRLRIGLHVKAAGSGAVIWADRLDAPLENLFELQDQIVAQVVSAVFGRINANMLAAARRKPAKELRAYDAWLRGVDELKQGSLKADRAARDLFDQALASDPTFARAYLGLSLTYFNEWSCQLWESWDHNEQMAYSYATKANELDENDHFVHMVLGRLLLFRREFDRGEAHIDRALALNRNDPDCLVQLSIALAFLGRGEEALEVFTRATRLHPQHPLWYHAYAAPVCFLREEYSEALDHARRVPLDIMVDLPAFMAVAFLHTGQLDKARVHVDHFLRQFREKIAVNRDPEPGEALRWVKHVNPYRRPIDEDRLTEGLHRIGLMGSVKPAPLQTPATYAMFRRRGSLWQVSYAGRDAHLPHVKGFADIAALLAAPDKEIHCLDLMQGTHHLDLPREGEGVAAIDAQARQAYEERIADLDAALAESDAANDFTRSEALHAERDALVEHLAQALGLGGRPRKLGDAADRARAAVTQRIRAAIKRLEDHHPDLARHLEKAIKTGTFCAYSPENPLEWQL